MGKKTDKIVKEKGATAPAAEEIINKTPEPYQCIGNFATDFTELFRERNAGYQLPIVVRNKSLYSQNGLSIDSNPNLQTGKKGSKDDKRPQIVQHQLDPEQMSQEDKEIVNFFGFKPTKFVIKPTFSALKPSIVVETDNVEKLDNITEISIRRWKVNLPVIELLGLCFSAVTKLTSITFWRVGLTSEAISQLAETLSKCETIKFMAIENNQDAEFENYHELIKSGSHLTKLHLRYCNITPKGAQLLSDELGSLTYIGNSKLLVLDLSGSKLGDFGAIAICKALKINRTLLSLSLSNCDIGDLACIEFAKMISRYLLTDEEIFARRQMMSERSMTENAKSISPPLSRRGEFKDRPVSVRSGSKEDKIKKDKNNANIKLKKDVKEEKQHDKPIKGKKDDKTVTTKKIAIDISKSVSKPKGGRSARQPKGTSQMDNVSEAASENMDNIHPLLHKVEPIEPGKLMISGNFMLLMLNFSRNRITEKSLNELNVAIAFQSSSMALSKSNRTGLLKLFMQGNKFEESDDKYLNIQNMLASRDHKAKNPNTEIE